MSCGFKFVYSAVECAVSEASYDGMQKCITMLIDRGLAEPGKCIPRTRFAKKNITWSL